jgi:thiol-disulfide isomerase/thioredoxin
MASFFNQYSFVIVSALVAFLAGVVLLSRHPGWREYLALAALVGGLALAWAILHPRQTALSADASAIQEMIGSGTPVLLELQSPYCIACTAIKPAVDSLEAELKGRLRVIRLNVQDPAGRQLARRYGFSYTPTFIFFDAQGEERWRQVGGLDTQHVRESLQ